MTIENIPNTNSLPKHIAIIMDGNGRWAERRGLPRQDGHSAGVTRIRTIIECLADHNVKYLTLYSFSTENWSRPKEEVQFLFKLLEKALREETPELHRKGVKITHIGHLEPLPDSLQDAIRQAEELTRDNTTMTCNVAFNYGGRAEILDAVCRIIEDRVSSKDITEGLFNGYLHTAGMPDVDLIIRTGGELRISNFLMWQSAYSEFYFTRVLWPDFGKKELERALSAYSQRKRRFGGL